MATHVNILQNTLQTCEHRWSDLGLTLLDINGHQLTPPLQNRTGLRCGSVPVALRFDLGRRWEIVFYFVPKGISTEPGAT